MNATSEHLFLIQDGARYHTSASTREFFRQQRRRLTVWQLPSYSPDYNPIEYLWRKTKKRATHNRYFAQFEQLQAAVEATLGYWTQHREEVLCLFGCYRSQDQQQAHQQPQSLQLAA